MNSLHPPQALQLRENKSEDWRKWKQRWQNYAVASGLSSKTAVVQTATFLHVIGEDGLELYDQLTWAADEDNRHLETIIHKFESFCVPKKNLTIERHTFNMRNQNDGETIDEFVTALQKLACNCEFAALTESLIKDRLVAGIQNDRLRERLLEKTDLKLDEAISTLRAAEASKFQARTITGKQMPTQGLAVEVDEVRAVGRNINYRTTYQQGTSRKTNENNVRYQRPNSSHQNRWAAKERSCDKCGLTHNPRSCPAFGLECFYCKKLNHYSRVCRKRERGSNSQILALQLNNSSEDLETETLFIGEINKVGCIPEETHDWHETLMINNHPVVFKLDTGAQCNVMPKHVYDKLSTKELNNTTVRLRSYTKEITGAQCNVMPKHVYDRLSAKELNNTTVRLRSYNKEIIEPLGKTELLCAWRGEQHHLVFQVIAGDYAAIIGKLDCVKLNMITRTVTELRTEQELFNNYKEVFEGNGHLPGEYHIKLDPSKAPVINPPRKVPFALQDKLHAELNRMEKDGILQKVPNNEPTDWVHSLVIVTKPNGEVRICIDPKSLNRSIKREHHPLCTLEEIASKVLGAKFFSVLDAEKAFYQIKLTEESSKILTFNTPFGRYRYLRMPMGISSATEIYQRRSEEIFGQCEGVKTAVDDTLVWGRSEEEHDIRLENALEEAKKNNLKLNRKKCQIKNTEVRFLGHIFTDQGLKPDEQKCRAIREMKQPENRSDIQRLLGMLNYEAKFISNLSELTAPLRQLLSKDVEWHWTPEINDCFSKLKEVLTNPPVLAYYNPNSILTLQVDASSKGLGACLLQGGRPIAYASKALTVTQQGYSQMEKEMLSILFGCTKFDVFIT